MLKAAIVGFGVMGKTHCRYYQKIPSVQVTAICEASDIKKTTYSHTAANLGKIGTNDIDINNIKQYKNYQQMLNSENLDIISVTLPTYMHADYTIQALNAGIHVLCEKPMALTIDECQRMIAAANQNAKVLQIAHCIRFWPEYVKAKQIIDSHKYGKVRTADFQRLSAFPTWGWKNWQQDGSRNGGAMMDLHIHDTDIINHWFGLPVSVFCSAIKGPSGDYDHIHTHYYYDDDKVVTAEASWLMAPGYNFKMSFTVNLEYATILFDSTSSPTLKILTFDNHTYSFPAEEKDGYWHEIEHFVKTVQGENVPQIITPKQSCESVKLALAEKISANEHIVIELSEIQPASL